MKKLLCITLMVISAGYASGQNRPGFELWKIFARVGFEPKYSEEVQGFYYFPIFQEEIKAINGKEVKIAGHFLPVELEGASFIISRNPYRSCFFCGNAGPESVAEVIPKSKTRSIKPDEVVTIKGILVLNKNDVDHLNFIIKDAELVE
ncbi:MAG: DUF3299 domain-containing protein [Bacteroidota bacterium]